jgi:hypothetical protein
MNQNIWGPHLWFSLHTMSFNYPLRPTENDKYNYQNFFTSLKEVIPCSVCKKNYIRHLNEHPIKDSLDTRKSLAYWVIDMHNMVNVEIGKKVYSYDKVIKKYEDVYNKKIILDYNDNSNIKDENEFYSNINDKDKSNNKNNIIYSIFILLFILLIINLINIHKK